MPKPDEGPASQVLVDSNGSTRTEPPSSLVIQEPSLLYHVLKRLVDIVLAFFGLLILTPVLLIIAICIKLDDGGSILHFREIIGYRGQRFFALFNVLVWQMSLVGPRMIHPSESPRFGKYAPKCLSVKPGITGLWQINRRQHISYDERVQLDMRYIDTRSFIVALAILVKTLKVFIVHTGA